MFSHDNRLSFYFASSKTEQFSANLNLLTERIFKRRIVKSISVTPNKSADVYYRYGGEIHGLNLSPKITQPTVSTLGFPTLLQDRDKGADFLKREANKLIAHAQRSELVHFHTDCMRHAFLEHAPNWEKRCVTAPFYLPHFELSSAAEIKDKFNSNSTRILFVGNGPYKGLDDLCKALDSISDFLKSKSVEVCIVSETKPSCHKFDNIRHIRRLSRTDVQQLMRQSHIYAMVPYRESFGLVYVEAMAAGCALIADNDIPRIEILDDGKCGMHVPPGRPELIARSLQILIDNRTQTFDMAQHGWRRAQSRYEPAMVAGQYASIFARVA
jgi:glycosyltransferase involved in cell wall biosynthesis